MQRRVFLAILGSAVAAFPLTARSQQADRMRRIGVLIGLAANDAQGQAALAALLQAFAQLGWVDGRNVKIDYRWGGGNADEARKYAAELVGLGPEVMMATGGASVGALLQASKTIPVVFANVPDPVGSGFVESLSRPGGSATGFVQFEYSLSGKWLELLKQIAPGVKNAAILWDPTIVAGIGQFAVIQSVAPSLGLEVHAINVRDAAGIERAIEAFARIPNGGMIVTASALAIIHRDLIVKLAARHRLPTVYFQKVFVTGGRLDLLRRRFHRPVSPRRGLCRSHSPGREAGRSSGAGADEIRARDQPEGGEGRRIHNSAAGTDQCRRGDRVSAPAALVACNAHAGFTAPSRMSS
jgi:putative ABC transport system substrate-binding protein